MGFYHYLRVVDYIGEKEDIGGYSKGGSKYFWFFAFAPDEYINSLQEALKKQTLSNIFVGYRTTVGKAKERIKKFYDRLVAVEGNIRLEQDRKKYNRLKEELFRLYYNLSHFPMDYGLELDQRDGIEYRCQWQENQVIGLDEGWYHNQAQENESTIVSFETTTISLEEAIEDYAKRLPNQELPNFFDELRGIVADSERGYGPNLVSEYLDGEREESNNPFQLFQTVMKELIHQLNYYAKVVEEEGNDDPPFGRTYDERDLYEGLVLLHDYMEEALQDLENHRNIS